ncbi:hypothetical protein COW53_05840 [bacterium CG17_big_fil_post_rev_8_21_14_2_50_64_8]|nr:MAG: hypothetical protein COW53_05840 [bacterium CG17_big_fil_post_rev_8_21_14_2_50_64_8]PJA76550.1 MAG: hypothetical protein CO151_02370 [bacterium CG_4_9_14_3_um_filter_65_15]
MIAISRFGTEAGVGPLCPTSGGAGTPGGQNFGVPVALPSGMMIFPAANKIEDAAASPRPAKEEKS